MLPMTAKLLTVFILPAFATTIWKYWTRSSWNCALAAAAAALLFAIARRPVRDPYLHTLVGIDRTTLDFVFGPHTLIAGFIFGAVAITIQWLIIRSKLSKTNTWQNAVLFGLAYTTTEAVLAAAMWLEWIVILTAHEFETVPPLSYVTLREAITSLRPIPLEAVLEQMHIEFRWRDVRYVIWRESIAPGMLYISMALAAVYSVRHRAVWPVFAAILAYMVTVIMQAIAPEHRFVHTLNMLLITLITSETMQPFMLSFIGRLGDENLQILFGYLKLVPAIVAALPSLALALYIRKAFTKTPPKTPETVPETP